VGKGRVELPRLAAHDPKSCLSASSSTSPSTTERERVDQKVNQLFTPELLTAFLQSRRDGTSEHTLKFYHSCLKRFLGHELTPRSINEFLHNLNCRNAKHSYYRAIRALCGWLCKEGYLEDNPMGRVDAPKVSKRPLPTVTLEQLDVLLSAADNPRDKAIVSFLFDSGLRLSEVANIQVGDIDWDSSTIRTSDASAPSKVIPQRRISCSCLLG